ncbi:MAG: NAD(+) synthase, partial [Thermoproteus sp.]
PIGDLYKTQVRMMTRHLGIPDEIALKPSSPRLWVGQTAEGELGVKYGDIDLVLYARELGIPPDAIPANTGVPPDVVKKVLARVEENEHKRRPPPVAKLLRGRRTTAGPSIYTPRRH